MGEMRTITYKDAVREAMCEEMRRDEKVFLMGEDIGRYCGAFGVSKGMLDEFGPERIIETPISETHADTDDGDDDGHHYVSAQILNVRKNV